MCIRNKNAAVEHKFQFVSILLYHKNMAKSTSYTIFNATTVRINFSERAQPKERLRCQNRNKLQERRHLEMKNVLLREIISRM
jgi:hypothetical protein